MARALGFDLSAGDGKVDFIKAKAAGISFMYTKASQQTVDPTYYRNMEGAKAVGILRGSFHYMDFAISDKANSDLFINTIKADPGELPPVIDYEQHPALYGLTKDQAQGRLWNVVTSVQLVLGVWPGIYTGYYLWNDEAGSTSLGWGKLPFWLAWWANESIIKTPSPWTSWKFWQYTASGNGPTYGVEALGLDLDWYNGTLDELRAWAKPIPVSTKTVEQRLTDLEYRVKMLETHSV